MGIDTLETKKDKKKQTFFHSQSSSFMHGKKYNFFLTELSKLLCPGILILVNTTFNWSIYLAICLTSVAEMQPSLSTLRI